MINIARNTVNTVVLTTTEEGTATYYLFAFKSDTTEETVYAVAQDASTYPNRYNKFTITETGSGTPVPVNGEVKLSNDGQWRYFVYANSSSSNLDPTGLTMLEKGIVKVTGTTTPISAYTGGNSNYVVYGE